MGGLGRLGLGNAPDQGRLYGRLDTVLSTVGDSGATLIICPVVARRTAFVTGRLGHGGRVHDSPGEAGPGGTPPRAIHSLALPVAAVRALPVQRVI